MRLRTPSNPINEAIGSFDAVDRIYARHREEDRYVQDRARNQAIQDEQMDQWRWEKDRVRDTAVREDQLRDLDSQRYLLEFALEDGSEEALSQIDDNTLGMLVDSMSRDPFYSKLLTPEGRQQYIGAIDQIETGMTNRDWDSVVQGTNVVFEPQINKGLADDGKPGSKKVRRFYPNPDGSVFAELDVTRQDGSVYQAPRTEGENANPNARIRQVQVEEAAKHLRKGKSLVHLLNARRIALGDRKPLEEAIATKRFNQQLQALDKTSLPEAIKTDVKAYMQGGATIDKAIELATSQPGKEETVVVGSDKAGRKLIGKESGKVISTIHGPIRDEDGSGSGSGKGKKGGPIEDAKTHLARMFYNKYQKRQEETGQPADPIPMMEGDTGDGLNRSIDTDRIYSMLDEDLRAGWDKAMINVEEQGPHYFENEKIPSATKLATSAFNAVFNQGAIEPPGESTEGITEEAIASVPKQKLMHIASRVKEMITSEGEAAVQEELLKLDPVTYEAYVRWTESQRQEAINLKRANQNIGRPTSAINAGLGSL